MKLPPNAGGAAVGGSYFGKGTLLLRYPKLYEFLADRKYAGTEQARDPGSFVVSIRNGAIFVTLKDATAKLKASVEVEEMSKLWEVMEGFLALPEPPWVADPFARPQTRLKGQQRA